MEKNCNVMGKKKVFSLFLVEEWREGRTDLTFFDSYSLFLPPSILQDKRRGRNEKGEEQHKKKKKKT